jgi:hypothetical protein
MSREQAVSDESGFALLDALIGLAVAGIVMLFTLGALRDLGSLHRRLDLEAKERRELVTTFQSIRSAFEQAAPDLKSVNRPNGNVGSNSEYSFAIAVPQGGEAAGPALARLHAERSTSGQQSLSLSIEHPNMGTRTTELIRQRSGIELLATSGQDPLVANELTVSLTRNGETNPVQWLFARPAFARARCVASPFEASCRP